MTRVFMRTPCFDSIAEALDWADQVDALKTVLHPAQSVPVVGCVEVVNVNQQVERD